MKNFIITAAAALGMGLSSPVWAETQASEHLEEDDRATCERYAQEDQIAPDQMAEYMSRCLQSMTEPVGSGYDPAAFEEESPKSNDDDK